MNYNQEMFNYEKLINDRIICINSEITNAVAERITQACLILESMDPEKPITLFINSPGGSVTAGMSIYDTMNYVSCPVYTVGNGMAASMGAFLLAGGEKGHRMVMPNTEILIHQPLGGAQGQATEIEIAANHIINTKKKLNRILSKNCGKTEKTIEKYTDRDYWMDAKEALEFGLVDQIIVNRTTNITKNGGKTL